VKDLDITVTVGDCGVADADEKQSFGIEIPKLDLDEIKRDLLVRFPDMDDEQRSKILPEQVYHVLTSGDRYGIAEDLVKIALKRLVMKKLGMVDYVLGK
jgi:hypothetical protein